MGNHYFIVFTYRSKFENAVINFHPMRWKLEADRKYPGQYMLVNWIQINRAEYEEMKNHLEEVTL